MQKRGEMVKFEIKLINNGIYNGCQTFKQIKF